MKVLEAKPWKIFNCASCGSKLEAEVSDVKCNAGRDISGCYDEDYYLECPVCGGVNHLSYKEVPPKARNKLAY